MVLKPQKKTRLIVLCAVLGALLCVALVFVTSLAVSQKYESILNKRLEADAINKPSASENEAFDVKNDGHENDWFYGIEEDVGMKVSNSSDKEIVYGNIGDSNLSMADVLDLVSDSVVEITTSATLRNGLVYSSGAGSGVIVNENGIIVTNNHVVEEVTDIEVRLPNGNVYEAKLIATDAQTDLAIIKITPEEELTVAVCGSSDSVRVGEEVLAIGNPLGLLGGTVTNGIISALEREITIDNETMTLLQHNAAVSPGNSGGALFNMRGELVGIVNAKYSSNGAEGLGFAIPINTVMEVYDDLVKYGYVRGRADHG
ncbi:MAG: trypsin-like peptidase domain-containing protein, partial [Clostridia bacterium]|nr:trypsin-like peptidase domain-containing protein [Clostridia bacterium]